jgi:hypothetical protein
MRLRRYEEFSFLGRAPSGRVIRCKSSLRCGLYAAAPHAAAAGWRSYGQCPDYGTTFCGLWLWGVVAGGWQPAHGVAAAARIAAVSPQPLRAWPLLLRCMNHIVCPWDKADGKRRGLRADSRNGRPNKKKQKDIRTAEHTA